MSETVTHPSRRCPRCGRQLPPDAPEGLCASCLLTAGVETLTELNERAALEPSSATWRPPPCGWAALGTVSSYGCSVAVEWARSTRPSNSRPDGAWH